MLLGEAPLSGSTSGWATLLVILRLDVMTETTMLTPQRLQPGDRVRLLSPASPPDREKVATGIRLLESWGLKVEVGAHAFDKHGHFLAGKDEDRLG